MQANEPAALAPDLRGSVRPALEGLEARLGGKEAAIAAVSGGSVVVVPGAWGGVLLGKKEAEGAEKRVEIRRACLGACGWWGDQQRISPEAVLLSPARHSGLTLPAAACAGAGLLTAHAAGCGEGAGRQTPHFKTGGTVSWVGGRAPCGPACWCHHARGCAAAVGLIDFL